MKRDMMTVSDFLAGGKGGPAIVVWRMVVGTMFIVEPLV